MTAPTVKERVSILETKVNEMLWWLRTMGAAILLYVLNEVILK